MKARKRFGQHFLEPVWVRKVIEVVDARPADVFLEIGPGGGALTLPLAERAARVVAIEVDRDMVARLHPIAPPNVQVVAADFLAADICALLAGIATPVRVAGNLPYNISSPILFRLLDLADGGRFLSDATLMLQREVADRLIARPGGRDYGVLAILAQFRADVTRRLVLPPGAFRPAPRVSSAVVHLAFRPPRVSVRDPALFQSMVRQTFSQRRKTLGNALKPFATARGESAADITGRAGIDPRRRPETLGLDELAALANAFVATPGGATGRGRV